MDPIFPQAVPILPDAPLPLAVAPVSAIPALWQRDRISRLAALAPEDTAAGLLWLAMNFPAVTDAMLDKVEYDAIDDNDPDPRREPEPFCSVCGADIGIFLRLGLDWRHFRGDGTIIGQIELFDPGHEPVVAWRLARVPAAQSAGHSVISKPSAPVPAGFPHQIMPLWWTVEMGAAENGHASTLQCPHARG